MSRHLPARPNLRHLKNEARDLQRAIAVDDGAAIRIAEGLPRLSGVAPAEIRDADVSLQETQHVLAREYGFASWAQLVTAIDGIDSRPIEELTVDDVRRLCHRISALVKEHGTSVEDIGPGAFYQALEAMGEQTHPSVREAINLAADGTEPDKIRHMMCNRRDSVLRDLAVRRKIVQEGVAAICSGEPLRLVRHRLGTVCRIGGSPDDREPDGSTENFRSRMKQTPASALSAPALALAVIDLAAISEKAAADLETVVAAIDDEFLQDGLRGILSGVDADQLGADLEGRVAAENQRIWCAFTALAAGLCAALEGRAGDDLDAEMRVSYKIP